MTAESPAEAHPEAVVRKRSGMQTVWIIPIVAALVGGWLWFRALQEQGPTITITFVTAEGLEAGKTKLKYKDLEVGTVTSIDLDKSLEHVIVKAEMKPGAKAYMVDKTRFWVVKPRIGAGGISGLSTIVSGSYIAMDISPTGTETESFTGLEEPPSRPANATGLRIKLRASTLGSISVGTGVSHLQIKMGDVDGYTFLRDQEIIEFELYIEPEYAELVRKNTRFWNTSGFDVELSAEGFNVHADSLETILLGGIAFGAAPGEARGAPAVNGDVFNLLPTEGEAQEINSDPRRTIAYFRESIGGLSVGSSVMFQGIEIGQVLELSVELNTENGEFHMPVILETYANRLAAEVADPDEPFAERLKRLVSRGMRAQLGPANLVTGARDIEVVFSPETPIEYYAGGTGLPQVPTIPSTGEALQEMVKDLPQIVSDLRDTMSGVSKMVNSKETTDAVSSVASAAASLDKVLGDLSEQSDPLLTSIGDTVTDMRKLIDDLNAVVEDVRARTPDLLDNLQGTVDAARQMAESGEKGLSSLATGMPVVQQQLTNALRELAAGMRSLSELTDYLERHPEALLKGKSNPGGQ